MNKAIPLFVIGLLLGITAPALSQSILVWDRDFDQTIPDPEGAGNVDATYGIRNALNQLGYTYDVTEKSEPDLTGYDVVFLTMGSYC